MTYTHLSRILRQKKEVIMKVRIDEELCTGCGLCEETAPEVFELVDDKAIVKGTEIKEALIEQVKEAADDCPAEAIIIEE